MTPFVVFALPRSRTAWLARFLSFGGWMCHHDLVTRFDSVVALRAELAKPRVGTVETGAVLGWRLFRQHFPAIKFAVVLRPVGQVMASLERLGIEQPLDVLLRRLEALEEVASLSGTFVTTFEALNQPKVCLDLFEHCLGEGCPYDWYDTFEELNIQLDMPKRIERLRRFQASIARLKSEVGLETRL